MQTGLPSHIINKTKHWGDCGLLRRAYPGGDLAVVNRVERPADSPTFMWCQGRQHRLSQENDRSLQASRNFLFFLFQENKGMPCHCEQREEWKQSCCCTWEFGGWEAKFLVNKSRPYKFFYHKSCFFFSFVVSRKHYLRKCLILHFTLQRTW